jgi:hypothetical protein
MGTIARTLYAVTLGRSISALTPGLELAGASSFAAITEGFLSLVSAAWSRAGP